MFDRIAIRYRLILATSLLILFACGLFGIDARNEEILAAYPDLEPDDIPEALHYAAEAVRERELPMVIEA